MLIAVSELCCVKNKTSLFADGRNDKRRKTGKRDKQRKKGLIKRGGSRGVHPAAAACPASRRVLTEGPLLVSFHGDKRTASRQLSKAICQMALAP